MRDERAPVQGLVLDERTRVSLKELCYACGVHAEVVIEMVEEGVLEPRGRDPGQWQFTATSITRAQRALRLVHDLRVNWPGAALALELLDQLESRGARTTRGVLLRRRRG